MSAIVIDSPTNHSRPARCALHHVEGAVAGSRPFLAPVLEQLGLPRVGETEAHDRDRRLVLVLLEEHPLQHLRPLVAIVGDEARALAEVPEDRARLGERAPVVEHERRHAERRVQRRRAARGGSTGRRRRPSAARTAPRGAPAAGEPCNSCPRPGCRRAASADARWSSPRQREQFLDACSSCARSQSCRGCARTGSSRAPNARRRPGATSRSRGRERRPARARGRARRAGRDNAVGASHAGR